MDSSQLLIFFIVIIMGFTGLIFILLRMRKKLLEESLLLTSDVVWKTFEKQANFLRLQKDDFIYGINQDQSNFEATLVIRNTRDEEIGQTIYPLGKRKLLLKTANQSFTIEFPLTMNSTASLKKDGEHEEIAKYVKTSWLGKHEFHIPGYGKLVSHQSFFNLKATYTYQFNGNIVGMIQNISSSRNLGRVAVLPSAIPLEIRMFMLSI